MTDNTAVFIQTELLCFSVLVLSFALCWPSLMAIRARRAAKRKAKER